LIGRITKFYDLSTAFGRGGGVAAVLGAAKAIGFYGCQVACFSLIKRYNHRSFFQLTKE